MASGDALVDAIRARGITETHYHVGPELLPRRYDVLRLADAAVTARATIVLKNHTYPTTPLAALARHERGARLYGSVVLNAFVGGINPAAIESAISGNKADVGATEPDEAPVVVWMPTVHSESHLRTLGHAFDPRWSGCCSHGAAEGAAAPEAELPMPVRCFDERLRPLPELLETLDAIARYRCILATGHLSAAEIRVLVPLALERGVPRVILTHPHYPAVALSDQDIGLLTADPRVFAEHCFAIHTIEDVPLERFVSAICASPPRQVILSTDFGQIFSDPFPDGSLRYAREIRRVADGRLGDDEIADMFCRNGRFALGLEPVQIGNE